MRSSWNPLASEVRDLILDADFAGGFPDAPSLLRHVAARHGRDAYDLAAVAILWGVAKEMTTPSPPEWRSGTLPQRKRVLSRLRRTRALD